MRVGEEKAERCGEALIDLSEAITTSSEQKIGPRTSDGLICERDYVTPRQTFTSQRPRPESEGGTTSRVRKVTAAMATSNDDIKIQPATAQRVRLSKTWT